MSRNLQLYLADILTSCEKIQRYTQGMDCQQFITDERTFDAVARNLQIIGEAVKNLPDSLRSQSPETEWRKIAGLRDILAHAYFSIQPEIIWEIVDTKIAPLQIEVQRMMDSLQSS